MGNILLKGPIIARSASALSCKVPLLLQAAVVHYDMRITVSQTAPDCFLKPAILVNGQTDYPIEVTQGDTLEVRIS